MNKETENLICDSCGATMIKKEKVKEDGRKSVFYVCPNWKNDGSGCPGGIKFPPREYKQGQQQQQGQGELLTALRELYKLIDNKTEEIIKAIEKGDNQ